jgi:hypothetical protein
VNPDVFPEPERFKPERWQNSTLEMERSLVPFSKGKRMCPGKELVLRLLSSSSVCIVFTNNKCRFFRISLMELFIIFAAFFRRFNIQVFNTT